MGVIDGPRRTGGTGATSELSGGAGDAHTWPDDRRTRLERSFFGPRLYLLASMYRVGVVGVSGYGGGEILRLCATHPGVQVAYVAGETSAGQRLGSRYPGLGGALADLTIQAFDPRTPPDLDLLFLSLPTGDSKKAAALLPQDLKIIDVGGDHRFVDGWTYGLTEITGPALIGDSNRVADPGCFPAASLLALAPLLARAMVDPTGIIIDAKTGISGAGRGGGQSF